MTELPCLLRRAFPVAILFCTLLSPTRLHASEDSELLALIQAAHRSFRNSMHTFSADIVHETRLTKKAVTIKGKYWRVQDTVRVLEELPDGSVQNNLVNGSEIRSTARYPGRKGGNPEFGAARSALRGPYSVLDVYGNMLVDFPAPDDSICSLDRLLELTGQRLMLSRRKENGHSYVCLVVAFPDAYYGDVTQTLWFDPEKNYIVVKLTRQGTKPSKPLSETEIVETAELVPGLFFPVKCRGRTSQNDQTVSEKLVVLTNVQVNKKIPKELFRLPVPTGTLISDRILGKEYRVDEDWRPIGPMKEAPKKSMPVMSEDDQLVRRSQSSSEPGSYSPIIIIASSLVLVAALLTWSYRSYNQRRQDGEQ